MGESELSIPIVKTARLELRIINESYLDDFHAIWSNPAIAKWSIRGISHTLEDSRARMTGLFPNPGKPEFINYGVFVRPSPLAFSSSSDPKTNADFMIGVVGVTGTSSKKTAEIGYIYNQSSWGQGYASEALVAYLEMYWDNVKTIDFMIAKVDPENIASVKVLKKCGFEEIEHLVGDIVLPELGKRDTLVFRIKRPGILC